MCPPTHTFSTIPGDSLEGVNRRNKPESLHQLTRYCSGLLSQSTCPPTGATQRGRELVRRVPTDQQHMPHISGIIEAALYVEDMQRSVEFYERVCGFQTLFASPRITALRVAPGQVLLIAKKGASADSKVMTFGVPAHDAAGHQHVAFGVEPDQLSTWRETLQRHGIHIESALSWPKGGQSLYFRDPDGHSLELKTSDWDGEPLTPVSPPTST